MSKIFSSSLKLEPSLKIERCPHCYVSNPNLQLINNFIHTNSDNSSNPRTWGIYKCQGCGGIVTAKSCIGNNYIEEVFPRNKSVNEILPKRVKSYLQQAVDSIHAPSGSIMLCASAVDAMLKELNYIEGSLYSRIDKASKDHLITSEMAKWAHQVRFEANNQRHSDLDNELPTSEEAKQTIEFTETLAEFLFVLPSKVSRGVNATAATS